MSTNGTTPEKERYQVYLAGREWGLLKQQVKARSGGICERCKINPSDAVHHLTYERKYHERLEDLQDTCEACYRYTHGLSDEDPLASVTKTQRTMLVGNLLNWIDGQIVSSSKYHCTFCCSSRNLFLIHSLQIGSDPAVLCRRCIFLEFNAVEPQPMTASDGTQSDETA